MKRVALYLRSSKDRADASIGAQRRALRELSESRGYIVVGEYSDAVESGKDENRPGFQKLLAAVRDRNRGWETLLVLDTARLARRRLLAIIFEEQECKRNGVSIVYKSLPEGDPITDMLLKSILQAMDEWHSMTSKQKGLSGLAENVRSGYRAGGRAPLGYRLVREHTGAIRDGRPVMKSKLSPSEDSEKVAAYLSLRAKANSRAHAAELAGLAGFSSSTLIGIERNALTYAGNTVWNVHAERSNGAYVGGRKRRDRSEWLVQPETHPALISNTEAEAILAQLDRGQAGPKRRDRPGSLLGGVLRTPDDLPWHGDGPNYRTRLSGKSRSVSKVRLDEAVVKQVLCDLRSEALADRLLGRVRESLKEIGKDERQINEARLGVVEASIERLLDLAVSSSSPAPLLRKVEDLERERVRLIDLQASGVELALSEECLRSISREDLRRSLVALASDIEDAPVDSLREKLLALVKEIKMDPGDFTGSIKYCIPIENGAKLASPRGFEPRSLP